MVWDPDGKKVAAVRFIRQMANRYEDEFEGYAPPVRWWDDNDRENLPSSGELLYLFNNRYNDAVSAAGLPTRASRRQTSIDNQRLLYLLRGESRTQFDGETAPPSAWWDKPEQDHLPTRSQFEREFPNGYLGAVTAAGLEPYENWNLSTVPIETVLELYSEWVNPETDPDDLQQTYDISEMDALKVCRRLTAYSDLWEEEFGYRLETILQSEDVGVEEVAQQKEDELRAVVTGRL